jgi:hypothetical protein
LAALLKDIPVKIVPSHDCGMIGSVRYTLIRSCGHQREHTVEMLAQSRNARCDVRAALQM